LSNTPKGCAPVQFLIEKTLEILATFCVFAFDVSPKASRASTYTSCLFHIYRLSTEDLLYNNDSRSFQKNISLKFFPEKITLILPASARGRSK